MTDMAYEIHEPVQFWKYDGGAKPAWVRRCTSMINGELVHNFAGGQVVYQGEVLVRELDGPVSFRTADEFAREFEVRAR